MPNNVNKFSALRSRINSFPIVLVTGGSGYIGSHTILGILKGGCAVVVIDNLVNSHMEALIRVYHIAKEEYVRLGLDPGLLPPLYFHKTDLRNRRDVALVFELWQAAEPQKQVLERTETIDVGSLVPETGYKVREYALDASRKLNEIVSSSVKIRRGTVVAVVHFAALKAVGESVSQPLQYYRNNITGLLNLLEAMDTYRVTRLVFSSSAVVYGSGKEANISEDTVQVGGQGTGGGLVTNPYGRSKWMAEEIINDYCLANLDFEAVSLRYFNPTGSHPSGLIGEDPKGTPNNIVPVILQAYQRRRSKVYVYGSNYDTVDGTGVRDYIHVEDLASGHLAALRSMIPDTEHSIESDSKNAMTGPRYRVYNLGTGHGYSVLDIIKAFAGAAGRDIPFALSDARPGDLGTVTASTAKAADELGWRAEFDIQDMCRDVYTFAMENPTGYERLRKLSTLVLRDPAVLRKASVAAGTWSDDQKLGDILGDATNMSSDSASFADMIRRLSLVSEEVKDELRKDSMVGHHGQNMFSVPQWNKGLGVSV